MTKQVYIIKKCSLLNIKQFDDILLKTWPSHAKNVVNYHNPWRWWVYEWTDLRESRSSYATLLGQMEWDEIGTDFWWPDPIWLIAVLGPITLLPHIQPKWKLSRSCWSLDLVLWKLHQLSCFPFFLVATFPAF